jgi:hypothetical protein
MSKVIELELSLLSLGASKYNVECNARVDDKLEHASVKNVVINPAALRIQTDAAKYGTALGAALFADPRIKGCFDRVQGAAKATAATLRVRAKLDAEDPALHTVRWEALRDANGNELLTGQSLWFSRYLAGDNAVDVKARTAAAIRALVIIASPVTLPDGVKPVPIEQELAQAKAALSALPEPPTVLARAEGADGRPTASEIKDRLLTGDFDLVYLLAHGGIVDGDPEVLLETADGSPDFVSAKDLIGAFTRTENPVRLVVLASCESAGNGDTEDAFNAFGPRLAIAGVPAVVAMQGEIKQDTAFLFLRVFFEQLMRHGQIDRAVAVARDRVVSENRPDYWKPALFLSLLSGSLWYAGFGDADDVQGWPSIRQALKQNPPVCTPILGPGLTEDIIGSTRDLAQKLAGSDFPLDPRSIEDLPSVGQYIAIVNKTTQSLYWKLTEIIQTDLKARFGDQLPADVDRGNLNSLLSGVGKLRRAANPMDAHRVLASKPFQIYITVNPDDLMEDALREVNRCPQSEYARWNRQITATNQYKLLSEERPDYVPSVQHPLVYHLFGRLSVPESLVITEDDYFDYLLRIADNAEAKNPIANAVAAALTLHALVFIGFRLDDWSFRVLLRSIQSKEGSGARAGDKHALPCVGAQLLPEKGRVLDAEGTRKYFEQYLGYSKIGIFWGRVQDFIREFDHETAGVTANADAALCAEGEKCCRKTAAS